MGDSMCDIAVRETVIEALTKHSTLSELKWVGDISHLHLNELEGGRVNNVFRVDTDDNNNNRSGSVVVKHAGPYFKGLREQELHEDRGHVEFKALLKFRNLSPGCVPEPVFYDRSLRVLCIEHLRDYAVYLDSLISGHLDDDAALKLARDVATIHRDTHVAKIGEDAIKQLDKEFQNHEMMDVIQRIHYTQPFVRTDPRNKWSETVKDKLDCVYGDQKVLDAVSRMKNIFLHKKEAFIHGDLHNNSIMVKDKDIKMIDCECAFMGPCSFDVGFLVRNYLLVYCSHSFTTDDDPRHRVFADRIIRICKRTGHAEVFVLEAGVRLLKEHRRIHSIQTLLDVALELAS